MRQYGIICGSEFLFPIGAGSSLRAMKLEVEEAQLVSRGGSSIGIAVLNKLKARASGGRKVRYGGHPDYTDNQARGGADVAPGKLLPFA